MRLTEYNGKRVGVVFHRAVRPTLLHIDRDQQALEVVEVQLRSALGGPGAGEQGRTGNEIKSPVRTTLVIASIGNAVQLPNRTKWQ
jgi:hypothetical protein